MTEIRPNSFLNGDLNVLFIKSILKMQWKRLKVKGQAKIYQGKTKWRSQFTENKVQENKKVLKTTKMVILSWWIQFTMKK